MGKGIDGRDAAVRSLWSCGVMRNVYLCGMDVRPKKALGQHFLMDASIAQRIVGALCDGEEADACGVDGRLRVLEVGAGTGVLTEILLGREEVDLWAVEIDGESVGYLLRRFPVLRGRLVQDDFLTLDLSAVFEGRFLVVGNFPYHISSQILFKVLEHRDRIPMVVGMLQKEVAERIAAGPGSKTYGILSVLLQTWYDIEYLFTVSEHVFLPPPKVKSAVVRLIRNGRVEVLCPEPLFKRVVKATFNQRRKTIRNSIRQVTGKVVLLDHPLLALRPEQLSVAQFIELTNFVESRISAISH